MDKDKRVEKEIFTNIYKIQQKLQNLLLMYKFMSVKVINQKFPYKFKVDKRYRASN